MHALEEKPKATRQATPQRATVQTPLRFGAGHEVSSILQLQRTIGNQGVQRLVAHGLTHRPQQTGGSAAPAGPASQKIGKANVPGGPEEAGPAPLQPEAQPPGSVGDALSEKANKTTKTTTITVNVQPVSIAKDDGSNPTTIPSFTSAQTIWGKCCISLKVATSKTISKTSMRVMDEDPASSTFSPSTEESAAMTDAGAGGGTITVIVPESFQNGTSISKDIDGGGVTYMPNKANATCFLVEGSDPTNVAHEIGHALGIGQHTAGTVMEGSGAYNKANPDTVNAAQSTKARAFAFGTAGTASDCTITAA